MIYEAVTLGIIIVFTLLSLRKNAVLYLSISFALIYFLEFFILYTEGFTGISKFYQIFSCKSSVADMGIFTAIYLHSLNPGHIFFNLLIFFLAGMPFERKIGSFRFTLIFLSTGVLANIGYAIFLHMLGIDSYLIGASGAIFGIMGAYLLLYPEEEITMFLGPVLMPRVKVKYAVLAMMAVEFAATFLWINDNVAHGAHVIGAVSGAVIGYFLRFYTPRQVKIRSTLNYELLESLADTGELKALLERIREEGDEIIQNAWIEEFFRKKYGDARWEGKNIISQGKKYRLRR